VVELTLQPEGVVRPVRFELTTSCSGGKRSIQTELRARTYIVALYRFTKTSPDGCG
jgi:hypothetical protein